MSLSLPRKSKIKCFINIRFEEINSDVYKIKRILFPINKYKCVPGAQTRLRRHRHLLRKVHVAGEHLTEDQLEAILRKKNVFYAFDTVPLYLIIFCICK